MKDDINRQFGQHLPESLDFPNALLVEGVILPALKQVRLIVFGGSMANQIYEFDGLHGRRL
jgi:hypothetical protein